MADREGECHSVALSEDLIEDPDEKARKEAENGLLQVDLANRIIDEGLDPERQPFRLQPRFILQLHKQALEGLSPYAGTYRPGAVQIGKSEHVPPDAFLVAEEVQTLCNYVNENWSQKTSVHLAAYVLWRLNWIHPFTDGNGRTARAVSYVVLCIHSQMKLPGKNTIPEQIASNKKPYYAALEAADAACKEGAFDVSEMEGYLGPLLAEQLVGAFQSATGQDLKLAH